MNIDELFKKRLLFFFTSFIFIVIVTISSSYAMLNNDVEKGKVINNGNLRIVYPRGSEIVENCEYPLSYQQGNSISPSNIIRIINKSNENTGYELYIKALKQDTSLDINKIYYSINDSEPVILGSKDDSLVYSSIIEGKEEHALDIKVWASSELIDNSDQGHEIDLTFEVVETNRWLVFLFQLSML